MASNLLAMVPRLLGTLKQCTLYIDSLQKSIAPTWQTETKQLQAELQKLQARRASRFLAYNFVSREDLWLFDTMAQSNLPAFLWLHSATYTDTRSEPWICLSFCQ